MANDFDELLSKYRSQATPKPDQPKPTPTADNDAPPAPATNNPAPRYNTPTPAQHHDTADTDHGPGVDRTQAARTGFLGWVNKMFNMNFSAGMVEADHNKWVRSVNKPIANPKVVGMVSPKGGVGKTALNQTIGSALSYHRSANGVVGVDADAQSMLVRRMTPITGRPQRGHSINRFAHDTSVIHSGPQVKTYLTTNAEGYSVLPGCLLSGDNAPTTSEIVTALRVLAHHYEVLLLDLPGAREASSAHDSLDFMDAMVYVTSVTPDSIWLGKQHLEQIAASHPELIEHTIVLLNHQTSTQTRADLDEEVPAIARIGGGGNIPVFEVAYDDHVYDGSGIEYPRLVSGAKDDFLKISAALMERLDVSEPTRVMSPEFDNIDLNKKG